MQTVNEYSALPLEFNFTLNGSPVSPDSVDWKMTDVASDRVQSEWASASVVTETDDFGAVVRYYVAITVPATANVILGTQKRELKEVTVAANKGTANEYNVPFQYYVLNTKRA